MGRMGIIWKLIHLAGCTAFAVVAAYISLILIQMIQQLFNVEPPTSCSYFCELVEALVGMNCMTCEMLAYGNVLLFAVVLSLLLIGLALMVARCFISAFRDKEDDKEPKVEIDGPASLVLVKEEGIFTSPTYTFTASGTPGGGTYAWSVTTGADRVTPQSGVNAAVFLLKPSAASVGRNDVTVLVEYTTDEGATRAEVTLTIHKPTTSVRMVIDSSTTFTGPQIWGWEVFYRYRINDQFGDRFPEQIVRLEETLTPIYNPFNTAFISSNFVTDQNAEYLDQYELTFQGQQVPNDYIARVRQVVNADGFVVLNQIVTYGPTGVTFSP